jgi:hypothetical protein
VVVDSHGRRSSEISYSRKVISMKELFSSFFGLFRSTPEFTKSTVHKLDGRYWALDHYSDGSQRIRELSPECQALVQANIGLLGKDGVAHLVTDERLRSEARLMCAEFDSALANIQKGTFKF